MAPRRCCRSVTARTAFRTIPSSRTCRRRCSIAASSYAIAHIRGGQEMGRAWYENGKLLNKVNTFTDFIDVTRWLVAHKYSDPKRVVCDRAVGGRLADGRDRQHGAAGLSRHRRAACRSSTSSRRCSTNAFRSPPTSSTSGAIRRKRSTTTTCWRIRRTTTLGTARLSRDVRAPGLWDSQVQYYEPTKWVARLRARRTGNSLVVLRTNMEAGHGGKSGRFEHYREYAEAVRVHPRPGRHHPVKGTCLFIENFRGPENSRGPRPGARRKPVELQRDATESIRRSASQLCAG